MTINFIRNVSWFSLAPVITALVSLLTIPFFTNYLDASDYGRFALGVSIGSLIPTIANPGTLSFLSARIHKTNINVGLLMGSLIIFNTMCILIIGFISFCVVIFINFYYQADLRGIIICLLAGVLSSNWSIGSDYLIATGNSKFFSIANIAGSLLGACSVFVWIKLNLDLHYALFVGYFVNSLSQFVSFVALLFIQDSKLGFRHVYIYILFKLWLPSVLNSLLELLNNLIERWFITLTLGYSATGLMAHSQQFKSMFNSIVKVLIRSNWSMSILEAREKPVRFRRSRFLWRIVDLFLILSIIYFIFYGEYFINYITNNKFGEANYLVVGWLIVLYMHNFSRSYVFILIANSRGHIFSKISAMSSFITLLTLIPFIHFFGLIGSIMASIMASTLMLIMLSYYKRSVK